MSDSHTRIYLRTFDARFVILGSRPKYCSEFTRYVNMPGYLDSRRVGTGMYANNMQIKSVIIVAVLVMPLNILKSLLPIQF